MADLDPLDPKGDLREQVARAAWNSLPATPYGWDAAGPDQRDAWLRVADGILAVLEPLVFSDTGRYVPVAEGESELVPETWKQLAADLRGDVRHLSRFRTIVADLDRNEHGRHEGDADVGDPTGVSQGNPRLHTGDVLGYSIAGDRGPYVMPERGRRHDPTAWGAR